MPRWLFLKVDGADVRGVASIFNKASKCSRWGGMLMITAIMRQKKQLQLNFKTVTTKLLAAKQRAVDCGMSENE